MINRKHLHIHLALIGMLFLSVQFGVLVHSAEHPFHAQDHSCELFLQCEKSGNGLTSVALTLPIFVRHTLFSVQLIILWAPVANTDYPIRAPPSF